MKLKVSYLLLSFIILLAFITRFWQLNSIPSSLTWDEVAWGYNAYSLGIDGKDEFGTLLPVTYLESFGDFKPPVYAYLTVIPVALFGLNEFSTRFPSALFGVLTVLLTYFLTKALFYKSKQKEQYALLATLFLAISPWHINLSRAAFEANVSTFFIVLGIWTFLLGLQGKKYGFVLSAIAFVVSLYTFNTARIVAPLLVVVFALGNYKTLLEYKKRIFVAGIVGLVLVLPLIPFLVTPQASLRFKEVNIFSDASIIERSNQYIENDNNEWWSKIIHNRRLGYSVEYVKHYLDHFKPSFLFIRGDGNPKFSTQEVGQLYIWELPFLIIGLLFLFRKKEQYWWFIPVWIGIGILPAATARETPHALRIETILPTFQIIVAYGVVSLYGILSSYKFKYKHILSTAILVILSLIILGNFVYYLNGYYTQYAKKYSGEWQHGYKEAIAYIENNKGSYENIYITEDLGRPYAYVLFYTQYNPQNFRKEAVVHRDAFGFVHVEKFNKYNFPKLMDYEFHENKENSLFINSSSKVPENATVLKKFYLLNGNEVLTAYTL